MASSQITTEGLRNYPRSRQYRLEHLHLNEDLNIFPNDIPHRQLPHRQPISERYQWPGTHSVNRNRNHFVPEYDPVLMDLPEYTQDCHTFKETDPISNTKLFGYIPKQEYLSHQKGDNKAPLYQGSNTLGAISTYNQGGDGFSASQYGVEEFPTELRRTSSRLELECKENEGESHEDKESQWKPKRHDIVPLSQVINMLGTTTACKGTNNETGIGTSQKIVKVSSKEVSSGSHSLNFKGKQTDICTPKDSMMTNHQTSKNCEKSSTSNQQLEISDVLLGEPKDNTCGVCQEEFQEPRQDANNQWDVGSFDQVLLIERCAHYFHRPCLQKWILGHRKNSCPFCRLPINPKKSA
jgi:hypothetical protein